MIDSQQMRSNRRYLCHFSILNQIDLRINHTYKIDFDI